VTSSLTPVPAPCALGQPSFGILHFTLVSDFEFDCGRRPHLPRPRGPRLSEQRSEDLR
jgi:hypothetical protein